MYVLIVAEGIWSNRVFYSFGCICQGGYAEYNRTHQRFVFKIPANLDKAGAAPLLCAGTLF